MDENKKNHNEETLEIEILKDEEIQVFNLEDLNFQGKLESDDNDPIEKHTSLRTKTKKIKTKKRKTKKNKKQTKNNKVSKDKSKKGQPKNKKDKQPKRNIAAILVILTLIAGGIFASWEFYFSYNEYNPFDYIEIIEKGADSQAYLEIIKDELVVNEEEALVRDLVEFAIPKNENLSLGDKREIKVILDSESKDILRRNKIRISPMSIEYSLGSVSEIEAIDLMSSLDILYEVQGNKVRIAKIEAEISNLDLKEMLVFETRDKLLDRGDSFTVKLKKSDALDAYLLEHGYSIEEWEKEFTVEDYDFVPQRLEDLGNIEDLQKHSLQRIEKDLNDQDLLYENFQVQHICFSDDPKNDQNARDKNYGHEYSLASLMYIVEFSEIESGKVYADTLGYTNLIMKGEEINQEQILEMNPLYEKASADMIKRDMVYNNFMCSKN